MPVGKTQPAFPKSDPFKAHSEARKALEELDKKE